ncbi:helix-turn-helix domain-containing protein [Streptomyces albireticuli]|uniref:HTH cro/C1-type domain-containing protein n=1 Tax=Streptomyces albireticuli TaxID=1940 RepID=A0A2A2DGE4_9ACTN|nr:helix-turn-helix transcriptional regulator [Streptomyces albireticuli]MCD9145655.1 helix-turn-helix domain-containing protein [Streptomyces albireticuli]MCD9165613.1 helix-turn-helix domain-containing protein [Streptomyces albireticuli]MCD9196332.1 helix-turn-helix domain-containing protein [Streptomyces albireticuli]PAU50571.1 hypothetical protein CK936_01860 [Streptomyces albireticuli]
MRFVPAVERGRVGQRFHLAARAGTGQAFVSRVESGKIIPTLPVLQCLATALECDVSLDFLPHR